MLTIKVGDWEKPLHRWKNEKVYLRYGEWGRSSRNHHTGKREKGISVYSAVVDHKGFVMPSDSTERCRLCDTRIAVAVTGIERGKGSDGEPVLIKVRALALPLSLLARPPRKG
jgi:hypothetical protein